MTPAPTPTHCLYCGIEFIPPPTAPHKRYCCARHRLQFYAAERRRAWEAHRLPAALPEAPGPPEPPETFRASILNRK